MQSITVKYVGATNLKPSRYSISAGKGTARAMYSRGVFCDNDDRRDLELAVIQYLTTNYMVISENIQMIRGDIDQMSVFTLFNKQAPNFIRIV